MDIHSKPSSKILFLLGGVVVILLVLSLFATSFLKLPLNTKPKAESTINNDLRPWKGNLKNKLLNLPNDLGSLSKVAEMPLPKTDQYDYCEWQNLETIGTNLVLNGTCSSHALKDEGYERWSKAAATYFYDTTTETGRLVAPLKNLDGYGFYDKAGGGVDRLLQILNSAKLNPRQVYIEQVPLQMVKDNQFLLTEKIIYDSSYSMIIRMSLIDMSDLNNPISKEVLMLGLNDNLDPIQTPMIFRVNNNVALLGTTVNSKDPYGSQSNRFALIYDIDKLLTSKKAVATIKLTGGRSHPYLNSLQTDESGNLFITTMTIQYVGKPVHNYVTDFSLVKFGANYQPGSPIKLQTVDNLMIDPSVAQLYEKENQIPVILPRMGNNVLITGSIVTKKYTETPFYSFKEMPYSIDFKPEQTASIVLSSTNEDIFGGERGFRTYYLGSTDVLYHAVKTFVFGSMTPDNKVTVSTPIMSEYPISIYQNSSRMLTLISTGKKGNPQPMAVLYRHK